MGFFGEGNLIEPKEASNLYETGMERLEMYEGVKLLTRNPESFAEEFYSEGTVNITYQNIRTKSIFLPN